MLVIENEYQLQIYTIKIDRKKLYFVPQKRMNFFVLLEQVFQVRLFQIRQMAELSEQLCPVEQKVVRYLLLLGGAHTSEQAVKMCIRDRFYSAEGADEIVFLDITATSDDRATIADVVRRTCREV